ncbi:hypothetical protein BC829DRAFT_459004 [Chytridium lagenaria]|nr:hypothetical protein BC829DRAFT_459004 [Chytridium lagenaria]
MSWEGWRRLKDGGGVSFDGGLRGSDSVPDCSGRKSCGGEVGSMVVTICTVGGMVIISMEGEGRGANWVSDEGAGGGSVGVFSVKTGGGGREGDGRLVVGREAAVEAMKRGQAVVRARVVERREGGMEIGAGRRWWWRWAGEGWRGKRTKILVEVTGGRIMAEDMVGRSMTAEAAVIHNRARLSVAFILLEPWGCKIKTSPSSQESEREGDGMDESVDAAKVTF